jgi:protoporphyrinogen oxidase
MSLAQVVIESGGEVLTGCEVDSLDVRHGRVVAVTYKVTDGRPVGVAGRSVGQPSGSNGAVPGLDTRTVKCDLCISTIPLRALTRAFHPAAPVAVVRAAEALEYKAIAVYGLLVKKPRVLDALYVYFRDRTFHRVAEPARSGLRVQPPGHTILLAELTCEPGDDRWRGERAVVDQIVADLQAEGLLRADDVVDVYLQTSAYGYPVFSLGFEEHLEAVQAYVGAIGNLRSTGRQGAFCYPNMHRAMRMGADAAEALMQEVPLTVPVAAVKEPAAAV